MPIKVDPKYFPEYLSYCREYAEKYRVEDPHTGPLWTVKQRFVFLYDLVIDLQNELKRLSEQKEEMQPVKIILTSEDVWKLVEQHLNEHVLKAPVELDSMVMFRDKNGTLSPIEDWDSIEVEVKPKESAK